jgi:zinc/manganese transport system ATP-binding protein
MTIKLNNLSAGYDRHPVVHHVSGSFSTASLTAVVGPNGGGKSTLLKTLVGFVPLMTGRIDFGGIKPDEIAYLPQKFEIDRTFPINVLEVVLLGHWPRIGALGRIRKSHKDEALDALQQVDMATFAKRPIISLSTGQWQRVLFARLILQRAKLILLDEPFAAIDGHTTDDLIHGLDRWCREGVTIICVMHDLNLVRNHFPQTLVLARDLIAWGDTKESLCSENMERALELAGKWTECSEVCETDGGGRYAH